MGNRSWFGGMGWGRAALTEEARKGDALLDKMYLLSHKRRGTARKLCNVFLRKRSQHL